MPATRQRIRVEGFPTQPATPALMKRVSAKKTTTIRLTAAEGRFPKRDTVLAQRAGSFQNQPGLHRVRANHHLPLVTGRRIRALPNHVRACRSRHARFILDGIRMCSSSRIYVAGHRGLVGSAVWRDSNTGFQESNRRFHATHETERLTSAELIATCRATATPICARTRSASSGLREPL